MAIAEVVVVVDQTTKTIAEDHLVSGPVHVVGPLSWQLGFNTGSAFSLFTGDAPALVVVGIVLIGVLGVVAWRSPRWTTLAACGLVLGGALGNLTDRVVRGHDGAVIDFINVRYWPTFNVADTCIVLGVIVLALSFLRRPVSHPERESDRVGS
jgi:signal peptidase II